MDSLTPEQQSALNQTKMEMRISNEQYIREHKELKHLISVFMSKILQDKPEDTVQYAVQHFTKPDLEESIEKELRNPTTFDS
ncbi:hypothetical protein TrLO_g9132 [Triparma laevis f. longispina]|uniref:RIIa domain-containing protein n=1 Tax=Triparma laevis f. longispina TaxID=1714387 RepID=A0A9W7A2J7_9STRA|nr:hypothetical protein TrLO_g9132 [Triparma laevis f. longispina]